MTGKNYGIDFAELEEKLSDPQTTMMILCNPHNPVGKIWDRETLARIGELCFRHHVTVLSDEIHCDLTAPGREYIPFASVSDTCRNISVTCIAPTKTFNVAGIQTAAVVAADTQSCHKMRQGLPYRRGGRAKYIRSQYGHCRLYGRGAVAGRFAGIR